MFSTQNLTPKICFALIALFFFYGWLKLGSGPVVGSPLETFGVFGTALMYAAIVGTFTNMFIAAFRAHQAGSWPWLLAAIFLWPVSYIYTLAINRGQAAR